MTRIDVRNVREEAAVGRRVDRLVDEGRAFNHPLNGRQYSHNA